MAIRHSNKVVIYYLILTIHFAIIFVAIAPASLVSQSLQKVAKPYMNSVFKQTWRLFTPPPTQQDLQYKYYDFNKKQFSDWISPHKIMLKERGLYNPESYRLSLAFYNLGWYIRNTSDNEKWIDYAHLLCQKYTIEKFETKATLLELRLIRDNIDTLYLE